MSGATPGGAVAVERVTLDLGGGTIVQVGGTGPALLLLHGEGGTSAWGAVHEALADTFTVYAPVAPGFGGTELPDWVDSVEDLSFHHVDLLGALGLRRPLVLGVSLGGWMALDLAVRRPDLVGGVVLVGALGLRPAEPVPDLFMLAAPLAQGYLSSSLDAAAVDPLTGSIEAATALWAEQGAQARLMWERPYDRRLARRLHHVTCPALVLWGGADRLLPVSHGHELARALGLDGAMVIDGAGHLATVDAPAEVAAATAAFARRVVEVAAPAAEGS